MQVLISPAVLQTPILHASRFQFGNRSEELHVLTHFKRSDSGPESPLARYAVARVTLLWGVRAEGVTRLVPESCFNIDIYV